MVHRILILVIVVWLEMVGRLSAILLAGILLVDILVVGMPVEPIISMIIKRFLGIIVEEMQANYRDLMLEIHKLEPLKLGSMKEVYSEDKVRVKPEVKILGKE